MEKMSVFRAKFSLKKPGNTPFAAYDGNLSFNISLRERNIGMYLPAALIIAEKISGRSQRGGGRGQSNFDKSATKTGKIRENGKKKGTFGRKCEACRELAPADRKGWLRPWNI